VKSIREFAAETGIPQVVLTQRRGRLKLKPHYAGHGRWEYTDADLERLRKPGKRGRPKNENR